MDVYILRCDADFCGFTMPTVELKDGTSLHYEDSAPSSNSPSTPTLLLIHGWSASSKSFSPILSIMKAQHPHVRTIAVDQRWHGRSSKASPNHTVSLLGSDITEFISLVIGVNERLVAVGTSLGAAVLWSILSSNNSSSLLTGAAFVDQSPCQWRLPDWTDGHSKGIFDDSSLKNVQDALSDMSSFADGNEECCTTHKLPADVSETLKEETMLCNGDDLSKLMDDHARLDWRSRLDTIKIKCVNYLGDDSGCFPVAGTQEVTRRIPNATEVIFEGCNHWLYLEKPAEWVASLMDNFSDILGAA